MRPYKTYNDILVFNPAYLGDTVLSTPLIRALGKIFPDAKITFCVRPEHADLFRELDIINRVITYDKRNTAKGISGIFQFSSEVRSYNFDLVLNLHRSLRSGLVCALTGKPCVVGFSSAVLSSAFNKRVDRDLSLQEAERNLMLLSALCEDFSLEEAKNLGGGLSCHINRETLNKIKQYYKSVTGDKKVIGIAPGSVWKTKRWLPEYFAAAADALIKQGRAIAVFGGPGDAEAVAAFFSHFKGTAYDFSMKTSMEELPAFLASLDLLITNDSGPMHIAVAADVPCVAVFGPTVKTLGFFPYDNKSIVLENKELSCRPCGKHGGDACPKKHFKCMKDVLPESVVAATETILI